MGLTPAANTPDTPAEEYPLAIVNDHLFVDLGRGATVLLDTGSSISLGDVASVTTPVAPALLPPALRDLLPKVSAQIGVSVTGLLGLDWLARRRFELDLRHEGAFILRRSGHDLKLSVTESLDSMKLSLNLAGARHRAFVDTGAPIAYVIDLPANITPNPIRLRDFTLLSGTFEPFEVLAHLLVVLLAHATEARLHLRAARAPEPVQKALQAIGCTAIVGLPILRGSITRWTPDKGLQITPGSPSSPHPAPRPHLAPRSPLHAPPAIGMAGLLANTPGGKGGDDEPTYTPIPLPESLQNFWQNVWKAAGCEGRAFNLADGASMVIVPAAGDQDWAIRCDLEVALVKDGPNTLLSALAKVHTDLGPDAARKARLLLSKPGNPIRKLFQEIIDDGGQVALTCDRLEAQLVDGDLLSPRPKADFPLGARLLIQSAFAFSKEFRENNHEDIAHLAKALKALGNLLGK